MAHDLFTVRDDGSVELAVHAQPGAGRSAIVGRHGDALKVRVAVPPERGRANEALVKLLSTELGVKAADLTLSAGEHNREKRFRITGVDPDDLARTLDRLVAGVGETPGRPPRDRQR
jgi:uncharacterized protein (TIGR00251 family)